MQQQLEMNTSITTVFLYPESEEKKHILSYVAQQICQFSEFLLIFWKVFVYNSTAFVFVTDFYTH